jgi:hypothetical protein
MIEEILEKLKAVEEEARRHRRNLNVHGFVRVMEDFFDNNLEDLIDDLEKISKH